jgi:hypothetical protein
MSSRVSNYGLYVFCLALILAAGCFPEESLDWSGDGSVGVLMTGEKLYVVDGSTGALTRVPAEGAVSPWPGVSNDGKKVVYVEQVKHATLAEGLKSIPPEEAKMIADDVKTLRDKILSGALTITDFNSVSEEQLGLTKSYRDWVVRSLCENADEPLIRKLSTQALQQGKAAELFSSALNVIPSDDARNKKTLMTSVLGILRPRLSPDGRYVAFLALRSSNAERAYLFVTSAQGGTGAVYVSSSVSLGFDWRQDSQALAYLQQESEGATLLGVVREQRIADPNGRLLDAFDNTLATPLAGHHCAVESRQLAGTLFEPLVKVQYGAGGRLFFSSASARIPSSDMDEPTYSLFCYDFVTGAVADVLPLRARSEQPLGEMVHFFSLSPDGRRVLLPMKENRLAIYELGAKSFTTPVKEGEEFGKDMPKILPAWKGNDRISLQVSPKSHFLTEEQQKRDRNEMVVISTAGDLKSVLSAAWPDEALPKD